MRHSTVPALIRQIACCAVVGLWLLSPRSAPAYLLNYEGANVVRWQATSPAAVWNDSTKTLTWSFNPISFPQANWPTVAQAGAAFQNAYQSMEDVLGGSIKFNRAPDTSGTPALRDNKLEMCLAPNETNDYFGTDISGAFAVTYVRSNATTGALEDADIVFNGDPISFTWATTGPPAPLGSNDIEVTQIHEGIHSIGGGHPVYFFAAVWARGRFPELLMLDRCFSPDDRALIRTLYPEAPLFGTISGTVSLSSGGGANLAVVVATDGNGIPQATQITDMAGAYSINVPAGTYDITVHHNLNSTYSPSDIDFTGASDFTTATTAAGVAVAAGGSAVANVTATAGTPTMTLEQIATLPNPLETQIQILNRTLGGTIRLEIGGPPTFLTTEIASVSFGPGVLLGAFTASSGGANLTRVDVPYTVAGGAAAGVRNITLIRTSGERLFLPSYLMVPDTGGLTLAAGANNPAAAGVPAGTLDRPLLQATLAATGVEDIRVRRLQFGLAGTGPALPGVRLWIDVNANGIVDAGDRRVFTGNAYASNPIAETMAATPPTNVVFDTLALPVLAGTTVTLLLTANMPAAGTGDYTASLTAANVTAHGMFYGDVITVTGGPVTGGTQTVGATALAALGQFRTTAGTAIAVGGFTNETQVTLRATVTSAVGNLGLEVEVKPLGTAFNAAGTVSSAVTFASGSVISLIVPGLADFTSYHWQARGLNSVTGPGLWVSFGSNAESAIDFSVNSSTTSAPAALGQFEGSNPAVAVPLGGSVRGSILLSATNGTSSGGLQVRLEFEVQSVGTAFTDSPNLFSGFGPSSSAAAALFAGATADYHWQVRSSDPFGSASNWMVFNAAALHFHMDAIETIKASAGCFGSTSASGGAGRIVWIAAAALLLPLLFRRKRIRPGTAALLVILALGTGAQAGEENPLPRSLADPPASEESADPGDGDLLSLLEPADPVIAPKGAWLSLGAYTGLLFMDTRFEAMGADFVQREVKGIGTGILGLEALVNLHADWRIGVAVETGLWKDVLILGAGPVVTWRVVSSPSIEYSRPEMEHHIKAGALFERLEVTKSGFGDFDATVMIRVGYEARFAFSANWSVLVGAELRHAVWSYSEDILSGDDQLGGIAFLLSVGIVYLP